MPRTKVRVGSSGKFAKPADFAPLPAPMPPGGQVLVGSNGGSQFDLVPVGQGPGMVPSATDPRIGAVSVRGIDGTTALASVLSRASKVVAGDYALPVGAETIADVSAVTAGESLLVADAASVLWGSSLMCTPDVAGAKFSRADLAALPKFNVVYGAGATLVMVNALDRNGRDVGVFLSGTTPVTNNWTGFVMTATAGRRMTLRWRFKMIPNPADPTNGTGLFVSFYDATAGNTQRCIGFNAGKVTAVGVLGTTPTNNGMCGARQYVASDGWTIAELTWLCGSTTTVYFVLSATTWDGVVGMQASDFELLSESVVAVENLSSVGTCTLTATATASPLLEYSPIGVMPEMGWPPDGSQAWRFLGTSLAQDTARKLALSAPGYQALNGTAKTFSLSWAWSPWQAQAADCDLWRFTGATALLAVELTTASILKITRTTDAGVTTTATLTTFVGCNPALFSLDFDGTSVRLYRQGVLVESASFSLAGTVTFTAGTIGGAFKGVVAEVAVFSRSLAATEIASVHACLAVRRGMRLEPIKVLIKLGQSNNAPNAPGVSLASWGAPQGYSRGRHYSTYAPAGAEVVGWRNGAQMSHYQHAPDSAVWSILNNEHDQWAFSSALGFHSVVGGDYWATVEFFAGGSAVPSFLPGGANNAAMLADLDNALNTIGLPWRVVAVEYCGGEQDAGVTDADVYGGNVVALANYVGARYGNPAPLVVANLLHSRYSENVDSGRQYISPVRCSLARAAATSTRVAAYPIDDLLLAADYVHLSFGDAQYVKGQRAATALVALGL